MNALLFSLLFRRPRLGLFTRLGLTVAVALAALLALGTGSAAAQSVAMDARWITTWATATQLVEPGNLPPTALAHNTLRQFVRTSVGGKFVRVRFSNAYGTAPVTLASARVALAASPGSSAGDGDIQAATDTALRFRGAPSVVIPPGVVVYSDLVAFDLPPLAHVALSLHFGDLSSSTLTGHPGSRTTSFIKTGDTASDATMAGATKTARWYVIAGLEVLAGAEGQTVVAFGDSITDGRGSQTDGHTRWPDYFAQRLSAHGPTAATGIANMGIGGNGVFGGLGPSGQNRFQRDVLDQPGARWVVFFIGVNDIGGASDANSPARAQDLINAFTAFANQAKARNLKVCGATITPFGGSGYDSVAHEAARQTVNDWIRTNALYDAVIDFDAAVRDLANPLNLLPAYNDDNLHLNPAGYAAMAQAIDLSIFAP